MNPGRHFGLSSRGLFVGAALFALIPAALAQSASDDPVNAIPAPEIAAPSGLEAQPQQPQTQATQPAVAPAPSASADSYVPSEETKQLTGRKLIDAPLANLSGPDAAVAEKLRELIANRGDRFFARKEERDAVEAFYRDRGFRPLWLENGKANARTSAAIAFLKKVDEDGLEPADYAAPNFDVADADKLADAELTYTSEVLDFTRHASSGRVHPSRTFRDTEYKHSGLNPLDSLNKIASAKNLGETLASFHPPHEQYKLLKAELAKARGTTEAEPVRIPHGPLIRYNAQKPQEDKRVPLLRQRLGLAAKDNNFYDKELVEAVTAFQKASKITSGGIVGPQTVDTLNGVSRDRTEDIILANMERWRWLPRDLGENYVITSIPGFYLRVHQDRKEVWETRVVVGMPNKITPITTQEMSFITVNPTWNVPPSIIARDYIPALRQDPDAMKRMGMRVQTRPDGTLHISQPPGDANALGRLRFNFPNKFLVYQHDTPLRQLFAHEARAYSAGCVRVQDPLRYAELLLNIARPGEDWTQEKIRKLYGAQEHRLDFKNLIPIHIIYNTAEVRDGKLIIRKDLYKVDAATIKQLKATGNERRQLEVAIRHPDPTPSRNELTLDGFDDRRAGFDLFGLFRR
jgi:murein L,D-transpeptidase YcbB/YkuD